LSQQHLDFDNSPAQDVGEEHQAYRLDALEHVVIIPFTCGATPPC
jgi:RES domain-containing protein